MPAVLLVLVGALAGFLVHNRYPARLFMGDAGSNFLGFLLGALTVAGTFIRTRAYSPFSVLAPLLVMAVPLYDTTSVILIRLREGRSPFQGDRRHFSHRLVERGLTPPQAVWTIDLVTLAGGLGALLLHRLDAARGVRGRGPDGLPARGGGHPGNLRRPDRSEAMARRSPSPSPAPPRPTPQAEPTRRRRRLDDDLGRLAGRAAPPRRARADRRPDRRRGPIWPSEPDLRGRRRRRAWTGSSRCWSSAGLALAAALVGGRLRFRWSWADAAVIALMVLVGLSAPHALDRRLAINLAWEWGGARPGVSPGAQPAPDPGRVVASWPGRWWRRRSRSRPTGSIRSGSSPRDQGPIPRRPGGSEASRRGSPERPGRRAFFENRVLDSNEVYSTFALANSLAGFLVGPLVVVLAVGWEDVRWIVGRWRKAALGETVQATSFLILGALPVLVMLICLLLTKSRSAYLGLVVGVVVLAWRERRRVPGRVIVLAVMGLLGVLAALIGAGFATGRLDHLVAHPVRPLADVPLGILARNLGDHLGWTKDVVGRARAGELPRGLPQTQAGRVERGDRRPARPRARSLGDGRVPAALALLAALGLCLPRPLQPGHSLDRSGATPPPAPRREPDAPPFRSG